VIDLDDVDDAKRVLNGLVQGQIHAQALNLKLQVIDLGDDDDAERVLNTLVQGQIHAQARNLKLQVIDLGGVDDAERVYNALAWGRNLVMNGVLDGASRHLSFCFLCAAPSSVCLESQTH